MRHLFYCTLGSFYFKWNEVSFAYSFNKCPIFNNQARMSRYSCPNTVAKNCGENLPQLVSFAVAVPHCKLRKIVVIITKLEIFFVFCVITFVMSQ